MSRLLSCIHRSLFSTLVIAEHNGKTISKNSLKLLSAAHKFNEDVSNNITLGSCPSHRIRL